MPLPLLNGMSPDPIMYVVLCATQDGRPLMATYSTSHSRWLT